jgi:hypothetical protein
MSDQAPDYQALANLLKLDADIMENRGGRGQRLVREIREAAAALRQAVSLQDEVDKWRNHQATLATKLIQAEAKLTRYEKLEEQHPWHCPVCHSRLGHPDPKCPRSSTD